MRSGAACSGAFRPSRGRRADAHRGQVGSVDSRNWASTTFQQLFLVLQRLVGAGEPRPSQAPGGRPSRASGWQPSSAASAPAWPTGAPRWTSNSRRVCSAPTACSARSRIRRRGRAGAGRRHGRGQCTPRPAQRARERTLRSAQLLRDRRQRDLKHLLLGSTPLLLDEAQWPATGEPQRERRGRRRDRA